MKNRIYYFIVLLLCIGIIPLNTFAVEKVSKDDGPAPAEEDAGAATEQTGNSSTRYYFMTYPNGVEEVTTSDSQANDPEEKLIFEGTTNEYGEIVLEGWKSEGQLRIVEEVPSGYTTNQREIVTNLSENSTAGFVNNRGIINPNTGRTILYIFIIVFLVFLVTVSLIKRQNTLEEKEEVKKDEKIDNKKSKKNVKEKIKMIVMLLIPVCILAVMLARLNVNAEGKNFVITVRDIRGNKMTNVKVRVYAKPVSVVESPAVIFDANGGEFFDGTTRMYFKLAFNNIKYSDFIDRLSTEELDYLYQNRDLATREGYYLDITENPSTLTNGQVIYSNWFEDPRATVYVINGNGGTYNFYGKLLTTIKIYSRSDLYNKFTNSNNYLIGLSNSDKCSSYNQYGTIVLGEKESNVRYVCWNSKPDGIYVNNQLFIGTKNTCFRESSMSFVGDSIQLQTSKNGKATFAFDRNVRENMFSISFLHPELINVVRTKKDDEVGDIKRRELAAAAASSSISIKHPNGSRIDSIVIRENGEDVLTINSTEIECTGSGTYDDRYVSRCSIVNVEKLNYLKEYASYMYDNCYVPEDISKDEMAK